MSRQHWPFILRLDIPNWEIPVDSPDYNLLILGDEMVRTLSNNQHILSKQPSPDHRTKVIIIRNNLLWFVCWPRFLSKIYPRRAGIYFVRLWQQSFLYLFSQSLLFTQHFCSSGVQALVRLQLMIYQSSSSHWEWLTNTHEMILDWRQSVSSLYSGIRRKP